MIQEWMNIGGEKGYNNGAGNPPNDKGIKTDYLWKDILTKGSLTNIIQNINTKIAFYRSLGGQVRCKRQYFSFKKFLYVFF